MKSTALELRRVQRKYMLRVFSGYRTLSTILSIFLGKEFPLDYDLRAISVYREVLFGNYTSLGHLIGSNRVSRRDGVLFIDEEPLTKKSLDAALEEWKYSQFGLEWELDENESTYNAKRFLPDFRTYRESDLEMDFRLTQVAMEGVSDNPYFIFLYGIGFFKCFPLLKGLSIRDFHTKRTTKIKCYI